MNVLATGSVHWYGSFHVGDARKFAVYSLCSTNGVATESFFTAYYYISSASGAIHATPRAGE